MKTLGDTRPRRFKAKASGSITAGKPCVVETDGDVAQVATSAAATGSLTDIASTSNTTQMGTAYDTTNDKVVVAYRDESNSDYGTAVVGTVSGNSISFGTPVVFNSAETTGCYPSFDADAGKMLILYRDQGNSNYGTAIVGTVSGTSISFGSEAVFESANTVDPAGSYDEAAQKTLIAYSDYGNSGYGTAVVATISGTSVSFGTPVVFSSASYSTYIDVAYDPVAQTHLVVYKTSAGGGKCIVGTVSGTSVSFNTVVAFSGNETYYNRVTYDATNAYMIIAFRDQTASEHGKALVADLQYGHLTGVVAYTSTTFESAAIGYLGLAVDTNANKFVVNYVDAGNSNHATYAVGTVVGAGGSNPTLSFATPVVYEAASSSFQRAVYDPDQQRVVLTHFTTDGRALVLKNESTNLKSENYIGIAEYAAADTETATVLIKGGVSPDQSSLTPGQTYFVQGDGTLGTSADSPSVTAGTAVTSTKLIVKG